MNPTHKKLAMIIITAVAIGGLGFFVASWALSPFFSGKVILPQSFGVGGLRVQLYGILLGLGALAGYWLAMRRKVLYNISESHADTMIFLSIVFGFIGARLYHVLSEFGYYVHYPAKIFAVWNGGLGIFGAAIGAILAIYLYQKYVLKTYSLSSFLNILDWLTPSIVVGQLIGRFGNFANYELYGYPTNLPWKMFVPVQFRVPPYELIQYFHPLFLYEAVGSLIILALLLRLKVRKGTLFFMWILLYNVMRFFLEFMRIGSVTYGGIRVNVIVAAALAVLAVSLWYKFRNNNVVQNSFNS